jgi:hypothetical protein
VAELAGWGVETLDFDGAPYTSFVFCGVAKLPRYCFVYQILVLHPLTFKVYISNCFISFVLLVPDVATAKLKGLSFGIVPAAFQSTYISFLFIGFILHILQQGVVLVLFPRLCSLSGHCTPELMQTDC